MNGCKIILVRFFLLQVVQELALVMYAALDIGLKEDEERTLTPGLENLLAHMISAGKTFCQLITFSQLEKSVVKRSLLDFYEKRFSGKKSVYFKRRFFRERGTGQLETKNSSSLLILFCCSTGR